MLNLSTAHLWNGIRHNNINKVNIIINIDLCNNFTIYVYSYCPVIFIKSLVQNYETVNIICVLVLAAIYSVLQLEIFMYIYIYIIIILYNSLKVLPEDDIFNLKVPILNSHVLQETGKDKTCCVKQNLLYIHTDYE